MAQTWQFIRFLNTVKRSVPTGRAINAVLDKYGRHKHLKVTAGAPLALEVPFHLDLGFPLNALENCCTKITWQPIRRGPLLSIADLQAASNVYLTEHNTRPKPVVWTESAEVIVVKLDYRPSQCTSGITAKRRPDRFGGRSGYTLKSERVLEVQINRYLGRIPLTAVSLHP
jgi:hypothetical protein